MYHSVIWPLIYVNELCLFAFPVLGVHQRPGVTILLKKFQNEILSSINAHCLNSLYIRYDAFHYVGGRKSFGLWPSLLLPSERLQPSSFPKGHDVLLSVLALASLRSIDGRLLGKN